MKAMPVSEFKAKCLAVLKEVQRTRHPLLVTLYAPSRWPLFNPSIHTAGDWDMLR